MIAFTRLLFYPRRSSTDDAALVLPADARRVADDGRAAVPLVLEVRACPMSGELVIDAVGEAIRNTHMAAPNVGQSTSEADRCVNTNRPLTHSLDYTEEGLAMHATRRDSDRFWAKVATAGPDDCWPFTAALDKDGYGTFWINGATRRASRVSWTLAHPNESIVPGIEVRHTCDNPPCVNPAHLVLGTPRQNAGDRVERQRTAKGDRNGARLYPERLARGERSHLYQPEGCRNGHAADRRYTRPSTGERVCRDCVAARRRRSRQLAKARSK